MDGSPDPNVFGIRQGIAVHLLSRDGGRAQAYHSELRSPNGGKQGVAYKLNWLNETSWDSVSWALLHEADPFFFLFPLQESSWEEYQAFRRLVEVMPVHCTGIVTARDHFVVDDVREQLLQRIRILRDADVSDEEIRERYFRGRGSSKYLPGDSRGWRLPAARAALRADEAWEDRLSVCLYRPFDERYLYYTPDMVDWPRTAVMRHLEIPGNRLLITTRQASQYGGAWRRVAVSNRLVESCAISNKTREINYCFPMLIRDDTGQIRPNVCPYFLSACEATAGAVSADQWFAYIVALLMSAEYQERYDAFLRFDFPRIAAPTDASDFWALVALGRRRSARSQPNMPRMLGLRGERLWIARYLRMGGLCLGKLAPLSGSMNRCGRIGLVPIRCAQSG